MGLGRTSGLVPVLKKHWQRKISLFLTMMLLLGLVFPAWADVWIEGLGYDDGSGSVYGTVYTNEYDIVSDGVYVAVYCDPSVPEYSPLLSWAPVDGGVYKTDVFSVPRPETMLAINGYPDGTFKPDNSITRAEFATILAKAMGWTANEGAVRFEDAVPDWARGYIGAAVEKGVINGYEDNLKQKINPLELMEPDFHSPYPIFVSMGSF